MAILWFLYLIVLGVLALFGYDLYIYQPLPSPLHLAATFLSGFALMQWLFVGVRLMLWTFSGRRYRRRTGGSRLY